MQALFILANDIFLLRTGTLFVLASDTLLLLPRGPPNIKLAISHTPGLYSREGMS